MDPSLRVAITGAAPILAHHQAHGLLRQKGLGPLRRSQIAELIAHGGPVQNACARIGKTSLERADSFYLKAGTKKLDKYQKSYNRIGDIMKKQGERVSEIWLTIEEERSDIETAFTMLKESKEYFNDLNETFGNEPAMNELKEVCDDLRELTEAALDIQNIVIGETHAQNVSSCNKTAKQ